MMPSRFHVPPLGKNTVANGCGSPPPSGTVLTRPWQNPTDWLSGANGIVAPSVPGSDCALSE